MAGVMIYIKQILDLDVSSPAVVDILRSGRCRCIRWIYIYIYTYILVVGGLVAQAVRRSPPTAGVPSSCLGPSMWVSWWTKRGLGRFFKGFSRFPLPKISFHHFSTLISSISFHFIRPYDGATGMVGRHPCYSRTYNMGASSHLIPRPDLCVGHELRIFIYSEDVGSWLNWKLKVTAKLPMSSFMQSQFFIANLHCSPCQ